MVICFINTSKSVWSYVLVQAVGLYMDYVYKWNVHSTGMGRKIKYVYTIK